MTPERRAELVAFLAQHRLASLSTVSPDGAPEAAVVEFGEDRDLTLVFSAFTRYRKYANLRAEPRVALVVGGWEKPVTLQLNGVARELAPGPELDRLCAAFFAKVPHARKFADHPETRFFAVDLTEARYRDYSVEPWVQWDEAC